MGAFAFAQGARVRLAEGGDTAECELWKTCMQGGGLQACCEPIGEFMFCMVLVLCCMVCLLAYLESVLTNLEPVINSSLICIHKLEKALGNHTTSGIARP